MKHSVIIFLLALLPMVAEAYDVKIDGIYYNLVRKGRDKSPSVKSFPLHRGVEQ